MLKILVYASGAHDHYSLALIDREASLDNGRVIGYDSGHEDHHDLRGSDCHRHSAGASLSVPDDCRFEVLFPIFIREVVEYCDSANIPVPGFLGVEELLEELFCA